MTTPQEMAELIHKGIADGTRCKQCGAVLAKSIKDGICDYCWSMMKEENDESTSV